MLVSRIDWYTKNLEKKEGINMRDVEAEDKMTRAMEIAQRCWEKADMPTIFIRESEDTGKIALAIIATKIFDKLDTKIIV